MTPRDPRQSRGPFRADQLRSGDPYELSDGHAIYVAPTGSRGSSAIANGAAALRTDPAVSEAGVDTGFSPSPGALRAPGIAIGNVPIEPGWVRGVPPLAIEYADTGQDEAELESKIRDLLAAGTRFVWVVRMSGARRVEVHEPGKAMRVVLPGDQLTAPGALANPVQVEALYDPGASMEAALRNLLQRKGYADLDAVRAEGEQVGLIAGTARAILDVLASRGIPADDDLRKRMLSCTQIDQLRAWLARAATVSTARDVTSA